MLTHERLGHYHMSVPVGRFLHICSRHLQGISPQRSISTTCLKRNVGRGGSANQRFLGTAWEGQKLVKCLRAYDPELMESGLVRGASVVSINRLASP